FKSIMDHQFTKNGTPGNIKAMVGNVVDATLEVYSTALKELLPTPTKSHYLFNLRDFSRVVLGCLMADTPRMTEPAQMVRLWIHEVLRVFYDRLVDDPDRNWLLDFVKKVVRNCFSQDV